MMTSEDDIPIDTLEGVMERLELQENRELNLKVCIHEIISMLHLLTNLCSGGEIMPTVDILEGMLERIGRAALYPVHLNLRHKSSSTLEK